MNRSTGDQRRGDQRHRAQTRKTPPKRKAFGPSSLRSASKSPNWTQMCHLSCLSLDYTQDSVSCCCCCFVRAPHRRGAARPLFYVSPRAEASHATTWQQLGRARREPPRLPPAARALPEASTPAAHRGCPRAGRPGRHCARLHRCCSYRGTHRLRRRRFLLLFRPHRAAITPASAIRTTFQRARAPRRGRRLAGQAQARAARGPRRPREPSRRDGRSVRGGGVRGAHLAAARAARTRAPGVATLR